MALIGLLFFYPYDVIEITRLMRGKNLRREAYKASANGGVIGTTIDNAERNSTFSPYSYILSQMKKIRCRLLH